MTYLLSLVTGLVAVALVAIYYLVRRVDELERRADALEMRARSDDEIARIRREYGKA